MSHADLFRRETDAVELQPGEILFKQGDIAAEAYVVTEGEVEVLFNDIVLDTVVEGGILGELALIDDQRRSATVRAKTAAKLARIDANRFMFLIQQTPFFAISVMRTMSERMRRMHDLLNKISH
ncbi:MAG: cyclic nucleotide-binding domain-containing protein [Ignavibacteriae bacterium]|nr:MAG: cyclic nucleotide-binding domain-containing protein [Ignavibacteriota bacterium]